MNPVIYNFHSYWHHQSEHPKLTCQIQLQHVPTLHIFAYLTQRWFQPVMQVPDIKRLSWQEFNHKQIDSGKFKHSGAVVLSSLLPNHMVFGRPGLSLHYFLASPQTHRYVCSASSTQHTQIFEGILAQKSMVSPHCRKSSAQAIHLFICLHLFCMTQICLYNDAFVMPIRFLHSRNFGHTTFQITPS